MKIRRIVRPSTGKRNNMIHLQIFYCPANQTLMPVPLKYALYILRRNPSARCTVFSGSVSLTNGPAFNRVSFSPATACNLRSFFVLAIVFLHICPMGIHILFVIPTLVCDPLFPILGIVLVRVLFPLIPILAIPLTAFRTIALLAIVAMTIWRAFAPMKLRKRFFFTTNTADFHGISIGGRSSERPP